MQQIGDIDTSSLDIIPDFFTANQEYIGSDSMTDQCNWKLLAETTMEGYHIKALHKNSFYPYGLDNTAMRSCSEKLE